MISVAIVEDNAGLRQSLQLLLEQAPGLRCSGAFATAEEALKQLPSQGADVVLMDINLPQMSGIECARRLREILPEARVIMITVYRDNEKIFQALSAGAYGYLLKRATPEEILEAIADVIQGGSPMSSEVARKVVEAFQQKSPPADETHDLSPREREVLERLAQGLPDKEISAQLNISIPTVRYHLKRIYDKLHVRTRTEAALKHRAAQGPGQSPRSSTQNRPPDPAE
jgi:DNA-binding NarL/FixJ family response regulator